MSDQNVNGSSAPRVSDHRVIIYGEPKMETITPRSGPNAGKEVNVLTVRGYHPTAERLPDGSFKEKEPVWYDMKLYDREAEMIKPFLKDGLALRVAGAVRTHTWTGRDGKERQGQEISLSSVSVDLKQRGLKGIDFEKPVRKEKTQEAPQQSAPAEMER